MSDILSRYEEVAAAAYRLHTAVWFYGENNAFPPGLQDLPDLDAKLAEALSHVPPPNGGNMSVSLFKERDAIVIQWTPGDYEGKVRIVTSSNDDVSETVVESNQGYAALSFPKGEVAGFKAEILSEPDGDVIDTGIVEV